MEGYSATNRKIRVRPSTELHMLWWWNADTLVLETSAVKSVKVQVLPRVPRSVVECRRDRLKPYCQVNWRVGSNPAGATK